MKIAIFFALLPIGLLACSGFGGIGGIGGSGGQPSATPEFDFTFSPPIAWTYKETGNIPGQPNSAKKAQAKIQSDLEFVVFKALEKAGVSGLPKLSGLPKPFEPKGNLVANCAATGSTPVSANDYQVEEGVVVAHCEKEAPSLSRAGDAVARDGEIKPTEDPVELPFYKLVALVDAVTTPPPSDRLIKGAAYTDKGSIKVESPIALTEEQWENIAVHVYSTLKDSANVDIKGLIKVKV